MSQTSIQLTTEQLRQLIESVRVSAAAASDAAANAVVHIKSKGSFSKCPTRFGGQRDYDVVEEFITAIVTYKEVELITDEDAMTGISLLFHGIASTWWQGVRKEAKTWNDVLSLIRDHFSPAKHCYQTYLEIFDRKQDDNTSIDTFVCQKRVLLAQLPEGRHNEECEIDFIYGLLNIKYRQHMARSEFKTFRDLLERGRIIELNIKESNAYPWLRYKEVKKDKKCNFCYCRGHSYLECNKRMAAEANKRK